MIHTMKDIRIRFKISDSVIYELGLLNLLKVFYIGQLPRVNVIASDETIQFVLRNRSNLHLQVAEAIMQGVNF